MKYGSVCSGIEAATVAWEGLGWKAQWYSEIEDFPSAVLKHRFPNVPNLGDMTKIHETETFKNATIDILVGGTPCQSFSVAGLRKGLDDERGGLMLTYVELAARKRPKWVVWENVPGVLSSNGGRDFASFLGLLTGRNISSPRRGWQNSGSIEGIGSAYGIAWRILDAQYFGVAQRRRRVFVVGYLGDWRPAAAVLFERNSLQGHPKPSRTERQETTGGTQSGLGESGTYSGWSKSEIAGTLETTCNDYSRADGFTMVTERMPDKDNFGAVMEPKPHAFKVRGGVEFETGEQGGTPGKKARKGYLGQDECAFTIGTTQDQQIATPIPFRKSKRASSNTDDETWVEDEQTNTLNTFDLTGDVRATNVVVSPTITTSKGSRGGCSDEALSEIKAVWEAQQSIAVDVYNQSIDGQTAATVTKASGGTNTSGPKVMTPIAVDCYNQTINTETHHTLRSNASHNEYGAVLEPIVIDRAAFNQGQNAQYKPMIEQSETMPSLVAKGPYAVANPPMAIRRLTPTETERLQGFPDGHTKIPYRNKPADQCPDGPRYKACGNSMAVPVMAWIGKRIQMVQDIIESKK